MKRLPPLKSLRCFVHCAKNLSFTKTADELNLTQGAVSKQISLLENHLKLKLFERQHRGLALTKPAKNYAKKIEGALKNIEAASLTIAGCNHITQKLLSISINVLPSVSSCWLIPLLKDFRKKFSGYEVVVKIGDRESDFNKLGCDLAIRVSSQKNKTAWKNLVSQKLFDEELICVCSPKFKKTHKIKTAKDLLHYDLLEHSCRPKMWDQYFKFLGLKNIHYKCSNSFEHFFMLIEAVKNGLGVGLVPKFLIMKELRNRELTPVESKSFVSGYAYFLLSKKQKNPPQKITDFVKWLQSI
ncbi:MAG: LysR family transcriptional regulator [Alphaproteobacteria bacterium]|nr:LysR family transcriptional regulator [Alphaproteobacteria bacterium]